MMIVKYVQSTELKFRSLKKICGVKWSSDQNQAAICKSTDDKAYATTETLLEEKQKWQRKQITIKNQLWPVDKFAKWGLKNLAIWKST